MTRIGIIGTIALIPFVIKIFFGMLSDRVNLFGLGYRKPYIVLGLSIQAFCLLAVPLINPGNHFSLYAGLVFLMMSGMALYDTCTDGLALDTTPKEEEGKIQGYMVGGRAAGIVVVSAVIGVIAQYFSWTAAFIFLSVITLIPLPLVFTSREGERPEERHFDWRAFASFTQPAVIALGVLGALYSLIINGANQLVNPFLSQSFGISLSTAGFVSTVLGVGIVIGGLTGGSITDRIGQRKSVLSALIIALISIGLLSLIVNQWMVWILVLVFGFAFGFYETVYFAISMGVTDGRIAATMFSILMAVANIGTGIGLGVTGVMADTLGFRWSFVVIALLNLLALPLMRVIFPRQVRPANELNNIG
jgi:MFS family permease